MLSPSPLYPLSLSPTHTHTHTPTHSLSLTYKLSCAHTLSLCFHSLLFLPRAKVILESKKRERKNSHNGVNGTLDVYIHSMTSRDRLVWLPHSTLTLSPASSLHAFSRSLALSHFLSHVSPSHPRSLDFTVTGSWMDPVKVQLAASQVKQKLWNCLFTRMMSRLNKHYWN